MRFLCLQDRSRGAGLNDWVMTVWRVVVRFGFFFRSLMITLISYHTVRCGAGKFKIVQGGAVPQTKKRKNSGTIVKNSGKKTHRTAPHRAKKTLFQRCLRPFHVFFFYVTVERCCAVRCGAVRCVSPLTPTAQFVFFFFFSILRRMGKNKA